MQNKNLKHIHIDREQCPHGGSPWSFFVCTAGVNTKSSFAEKDRLHRLFI